MSEQPVRGKAAAGNIPVYCAHDALVDPAALIGNPRNPNTHPQEQIKMLARIIDAQGWRAPITVSRRSGFVVRGHGRLEAALLLKTELVPVDYQDYATEAEEWADLIADNRLAELAQVDRVLLKDLFTEMEAVDFDRYLTGYSADIIESMFTPVLPDNKSGEISLDDFTDDAFMCACPKCGFRFNPKE